MKIIIAVNVKKVNEPQPQYEPPYWYHYGSKVYDSFDSYDTDNEWHHTPNYGHTTGGSVSASATSGSIPLGTKELVVTTEVDSGIINGLSKDAKIQYISIISEELLSAIEKELMNEFLYSNSG